VPTRGTRVKVAITRGYQKLKGANSRRATDRMDKLPLRQTTEGEQIHLVIRLELLE
jgi:hypothetical protein